jgi:amino acid adenylation domain-containing protein
MHPFSYPIGQKEREMDYASGYRLSPQQQQLWLWHQEEPVYSSQCAVRIEGPLDGAALRTACERLVERHEILRTTFHRQPGMKLPLQVIQERLAPAWTAVDLTAADDAAQQAAVDARLAAERRQPFDLQHGPLVRFTLLTLAGDRHVLIVTAAALCADARALRNLVQELSSSLGAGGAADQPLQYADYSEWRTELAAGDDADVQAGQAYWQSQDLASLPALVLPFQKKAAPASVLEPDVVRRPVAAETRDRLRAAAGRAGVSEPVFLLAGWQTLLWRLTGQADVAVGYHADGRTQEEARAALGLFAQPVPVRCRLDDVPFTEVLRRVQEAVATAEQWQDYCPPADGSRGAAQAVAFEYREGGEPQAVQGTTFSITQLDSLISPFTLKLVCTVDGLELHYDARLFRRADIERIAGQFEMLLSHALRDPKAPAGALEVLSESERQQLVVEFNRTAADYPRDRCIHHLFEEQAARTPDRPALACDGRQWTCRELNTRANQLAHLLRSRGVKPGARVGLCMERSGESIIALLGVLKAGAAYVPLPPEQPKARLAFQLTETGAPVLISQESLRGVLPEFRGTVLCLDRDAALDGQPTTNPERAGKPEDVVYVIYTSGSTGVPKGVAVRHRNLVNYTHYMCGRLGAADGLHFATVSTLSADLGNTCVFPALVSGGCLHVIPYEMAMDGKRVAAYAARNPIDVLKITPSHLAALLASADGGEILPRKTLVLGGEASSWDLVQRIQAAGRCAVINHYGPTETTVGSLTFSANGQGGCRDLTATVPVGQPIANTQVYVLDANRRPVPVGVAGELFIAGDGVAQGYLNQPEQTAERFVPDPFAGRADARMYRTGDQARYLPDGNIEFLGRLDQQVKIRGFRVEPAEVESVLGRHPGVRQAVVLARDDKAGGKSLVAYVVPAAGRSAAADELRSFLAEQLPHYMVPSAFVALDALPLTANGKIDRQALPDPDQAPSVKTRFTAPRNPVEEALANVWVEVLGVERVGVHDDFFELGGHSLLATQVVSRVRAVLGVDLPLRTIFEAPTVAGLAEAVAELGGAASSDMDNMLAELEGMSEEEVQRLLAMELQQEGR